MADHKITDFVDQSAIDGLQRLKGEMQSVADTYTTVATQLAKGLKVSVDGMDALEKLTRDMAELQRQASEATQRHTAALNEQNRMAANTSNTISRQLMEQEKLNEKTRDAYTRQKEVKEILATVVTSYADMTKRLAEIAIAQQKLTDKKREEKKAFYDGLISQEQYTKALQQIIKEQQSLAAEKSQIEGYTKSEAKEAINASSSYNAMSQELLRLKKAYKELDEESRNAEVGQSMLAEIKELGAHLKDMDASMGDFQRNVGDYAIACSQGSMALGEFNGILTTNAITIQDCIDQNKALEQAKLSLNQEDANYAATVDLINNKIEENKRKILDVESVMTTQAKTVGEAEAQNKQLAEAIKLVDTTTAEGKKKIAEYNAKIEENKRVIQSATPALQDHAKASEGLANQVLSLIGVNTRFGSSLQSLGNSASAGNMLDGLGVKAKALGQTLMGLLSNPWVLAFLGIGAVISGVKWWYDYNKGLVEASRLTENFSGEVGAAADKITADMQTIADKTGKGYNETIKAANTLVQQFGLTWDEAYQRMQDGIQAGADMSGNMLSNIERFAPALRDAGMSADEFMAVLSETRNGIFDEQGVQNIVKAGTRLRAMTKQTAAALNEVGISAQQMQADLEAGNISMFEAVQQVAQKLKELPENSQEAGQIMKNVFGRTAAEGGSLLLQSIADVNLSLDEQKKKMGELGEANAAQMEAQRTLNEKLMSVFKMSGSSFETMTTKAKTFVTEGLIRIIDEVQNIIAYWKHLYNESVALRIAISNIVATFKMLWSIGKTAIKNLIDAFKALGTVVEGVLTLDVNKINQGWKEGFAALSRNLEGFIKDMGKTANGWMNQAFGMGAVSSQVKAVVDERNPNANKSTVRGAGGVVSGGGGSSTRSASSGSGSKAKSSGNSAEKEAKEELKRINALEDAKLKAMDDGYEKERETIRVNYEKKMREIRGNSEKEIAARTELAEAMNKELQKLDEKHQQELATINLANRLAAAKAGSKEEYDIKAQQLEMEYQKEIEEAQKKGADVALVDEKYLKKREKLVEEYAKAQSDEIERYYAHETVVADNEYQAQVEALRAKFAEDLEAAGNNAEERKRIEEQLQQDLAKLAETYAKERAQSSIEMIEEILSTEGLSADARLTLEEKLAKAKIDLDAAVTDAAIAENKRLVANDTEATKRRIENAKKYLEIASDALNAIADLGNAIFEGKIENIEAEEEANTEACEAEKERITELVESKVITEEEGEARKRAAEAKTALKEEELEKKKMALKRKQAIWDKANQVAQCAIATAMAIMQTMASMGMPAAIPMIAVTAALGAIQLATILATPIPKYAKGTKDHPGGYAIVGDAGKHEVIRYGGNLMLSPDTPTLVDMPKGAEVFPDVEQYLNANALTSMPAMDSPRVVVNNDYSDLKREVMNLGKLIKYQTKAQKRSAMLQDYQQYKIANGL